MVRRGPFIELGCLHILHQLNTLDVKDRDAKGDGHSGEQFDGYRWEDRWEDCLPAPADRVPAKMDSLELPRSYFYYLTLSKSL